MEDFQGVAIDETDIRDVDLKTESISAAESIQYLEQPDIRLGRDLIEIGQLRLLSIFSLALAQQALTILTSTKRVFEGEGLLKLVQAIGYLVDLWGLDMAASFSIH